MGSFFAMLSRMKYINRWSLMRCTRPETLSEHTLEVALLAHALATLAQAELQEEIDPGQVVLCALYHDSSEIITGDMPTPIKYHNTTISGAYQQIEYQANQRLLSLLPQSLTQSYAPLLAQGAVYQQVYPYVKAADKLSAVIKCMEELQAGNRDFIQAKETCLAHPCLLLPAAQIFIRRYLPAYLLTLDELESYTVEEVEQEAL